jgi:LysR family transcriptional regulator, regulator of abg operon
MKLNQVRDIIAVAERGSLRSAARFLGVAQPAITRSIRELERELGVTLFERQSTGVVLTPLGEIFLRRAKAAHGELIRAQEELDQYRGEAHGTLRVCLSSASQIALLPHTLSPFRERYSAVTLEIVEGLFTSAEASLKDGTLDCYIGPLAEESLSGELLFEKLFDNERLVFGRKGHPLANAKTLAELVEAQWIATTVTVKADAELGPMFSKFGLPSPKIAVHSSSSLSMITMATYSDLLAMLPMQWTQVPWLHNLLERIHVKEFLPSAAIYIVRRASLPLTPAAEYFCDMARRAGQQQPGRLNRTPRDTDSVSA